MVCSLNASIFKAIYVYIFSWSILGTWVLKNKGLVLGHNGLHGNRGHN